MNAPLPKCTSRLLWTCFHSTVCVRRKTFRSAKSPPTVPSRPPGHQKRVESNCPFRNISRLVAWWDWRTARWSIRFSCRNTARRSKRSVALPVREVCIDLRRKCCCCTSRTQRQLSRWSIQSTKRFCGESVLKKFFCETGISCTHVIGRFSGSMLPTARNAAPNAYTSDIDIKVL